MVKSSLSLGLPLRIQMPGTRRKFSRLFGQLFGRTFGRFFGQLFSRTFGRFFGQLFGQTFRQTFGRTFRRTGGRMFGRIYIRKSGQLCRRRFGWTFGRKTSVKRIDGLKAGSSLSPTQPSLNSALFVSPRPTQPCSSST